MTEYTALLEELQSTKRQLGSYRKKYATLESDNVIVHESEQALKRNLQSLKQRNSVLESQNDILRKENDRLIRQYQVNVQAIKAQVDRKQQNINELEVLVDTTNLKGNLLRKQIQCEIQAKFMDQIQSQQNKYQEIQSKYDSLKRQSALQKEKSEIKIKALESSIQETQAKHLQEMKEYANKLYQQSQRKAANSDVSMMKSLRRQVDCLRNMLSQKDNQIQALMGEKSEVMEQKWSISKTEQKQKEELVRKVAEYKRLLDQKKDEISIEQAKQQNKQMLRYETELKRYKEEIKKLQQEVGTHQVTIMELKNRQKELKVEIENTVHRNREKNTQKLDEAHTEVEQLKRELRSMQEQAHYYKSKYNTSINVMNSTNTREEDNTNTNTNIRKIQNQSNTNQNYRNYSDTKNNQIVNREDISNKKQSKNVVNQLNSSYSNINQRNVVNEVNVIEERNIKNIKRIYKQQDEQEDIQNPKKQQHSNTPRRGSNNIEDDYQRSPMKSGSRYEREDSPIEKLKIEKQREKVREIARKYIELQKKYDKCKAKLEEANQKVLQLIRNKIAMVSPPKTFNEGMVTNSKGKPDPEAYLTGSDKINSTGNHFYRSASPKNNKFYEKSLNFKSKANMKDMKCLNHDHSVQGRCEH